ncbi:MAG: hypothetical protein K2X77_22915 [Candidatus Obscuribacterales bacterium]|jgi:hypothetical protein|nr:hypothetical protein [Candidatus Obscuribacterales bacterium]
MNPFNRKLTASLAGVIFASSSLMVVGAQATQVGGVDTDFLANDYGLAKEVIGDVSKSQPTDDSRAAYGEFKAVKNLEKLPEGTLVKTGNKSQVSIEWMANAKRIGLTRLWANTVATVSTKTKLVYLQKGEIHHNKIETTGTDHVIETKLLQARIHGTTCHVTVEFQGDKEIHRIAVSELGGRRAVEVLNRLNGSRVNLRPGIVLEIRGVITSPPPVSSLPSAAPSNMCLKPDKGELIFQDNKTQMIAYVMNSKTVLDHPAVRGGDGVKPIPSLEFIRRDMAKIPSSDNFLSNFVDAAINIGKPDKLITKNLSIACVPKRTAYYVGPNVGQSGGIELPSLAYTDLHPAGVIAARDVQNILANAPSGSSVASSAKPVLVPVPRIPFTELTPDLPIPDLLTDRFADRASMQPVLQGQLQQFAQQPMQIPQNIQQVQTQMPVQTQLPVPITPIAPLQFSQPQQVLPFQQQQNLSIVPFNSQGPALPIGGFNKADNLQTNLQNLGKAN